MARTDWAYVPAVESDAPTPSADAVKASGLRVGFNDVGRDGWIAVQHGGLMAKAAYVWDASGSYPYGSIIVGFLRSSLPSSGYESVFAVQSVDGVLGNVYETKFYKAGRTGNIGWESTSNLGQVKCINPDLRNPDIPTYASEDDAVAAMDDGIWTPPPEDPNDQGGTSGPGGGTGTFDGTSDPIDFQGLPTLSAVQAGFVTIYNPTITQMQQLANYMWTSDFIDNIKKLFGDPMDAILGLSIVPLAIPQGASQEVKVGFVGTGVTMTLASTQYVTVDCGSLNIQEFWGSALDYSPYTKCQIYLPYIGVREINTDDIMGKTIHVVYNCDILSGAVTAQIKCGNAVLYQFSGSIASAMPITGRDFAQVISATISAIGTVGALVATGGASAPITAAMAVSGVMSTANNVMGAKPRIEHSGSMGSTAGLMGQQKPYLIVERPRQALPEKYKSYRGYPSNIYFALSALKGFTQIEDIHLENIPATDAELDEIETLLKDGVIL